MKKIFRIAAVFICLLFLDINLFSQSNNSQDSCANISLKLNKTEYLESEPVWIEKLFTKNNTCKLDYEPELGVGGSLGYILTNSAGDTLSPKIISDYMYDFGNCRDTIWDAEQITETFGIGEDFGFSTMLLWIFLPADSYKIKAIVKLRSDNVYKDIISNTISFKVSKAMGDEAAARKLLLQMGKAFADIKDANFRNEIVNEFEKLHFGSVYAERMNHYKFSTYNTLFSEFSYQQKRELLTKYILAHPDDYYCGSYLFTIIENYIKDPDGALKVLDYFIKNCRNTVTERMAKRIISNLFRSQISKQK